MTAGPAVRSYEQVWENYTGCRHAIMVSSGSAANEMIARHRKKELIESGHWPSGNKVILPVCTWVSSVSPWIQEGFVPVWCDISTNLCAPVDAIAKIIKTDQDGEIRSVFYTTLLGQADYLPELRAICVSLGVKLMLDNCESSFSSATSGEHFCSFGLSSTSFYFSHPATTGTEGGMIFCESDADADWFRMMRNHGLTRGMPERYRNEEADPAFDFHLPGTNARSSDLQAHMGSLIFKRSLAFCEERKKLSSLFYATLDAAHFCDVTQGNCSHPLMALPIVPNPVNRRGHRHVSALLARLGIEHRPIVGGNLLRHTAFKQFGNAKLFPRAEWLHDNCAYVGLHAGVTESMVVELAMELNRA